MTAKDQITLKWGTLKGWDLHTDKIGIGGVMWIVEIEEGVWLAPWEGDPGRTLNRDSARKYASERKALGALLRVLRSNPHRKMAAARVVPDADSDGTTNRTTGGEK